MILLDSNIVIWMLRGRKEVIEIVDKLSASDRTVISVITIAEAYQNVFPHEMEEIDEYFDIQEILDVNKFIAKTAGLYWNRYHKSLAKLGTTDCLVAATAKFYDCPLITLNTRHFPMSDIKVINPLR